MKPIDYMIIAVAVLAVVSVTLTAIRNKRKGKNGCGCGCDGCPSKGACGGASTQEKKDEEKN